MERKLNALSFLKGRRFLVFLAPALKIIECITELAVPFLVRAIIDQGLTAPLIGADYGAHYRELPYIFGLAGLIFLFAFVGFACTMCSQYLAAKVSTDYAYDLKKALYGKLLSSSSADLDSFGKGQTLNFLTADSYRLQVGVQLFMRLMVRAPFLVLGSILAGFLINLYAGIAILLALAFCALVIFIVLRITPGRYAKLSVELDALSTLGDGATSGGRVLRAFNQQEEAKADFERESERYRRFALALTKANAFINPLTFAFVNLAVVAMLYLGSFALPQSELSVGSIVALISFLTQSLAALLQFTRLVTSMSQALASKKRVDAFLGREESLVEGARQASDFVPGAHVFEMKGASLSFGGEKFALEDCSFYLDEGESVGIIGGTGSGKSTILSLLERFFDPSVGTIDFRGHPLPEYAFSAFRGQIALVSQKPQIFRGTLKENLTLGQARSEEEIASALRDALCDEFVCHYQDGIDHPLEEKGANLSGGQKQRMLLARALLSKRPILMLDDAMSALDYKSDLAVRENIRRRKLTTVLVSQRATSIASCDRIYVLDGGKIVGVGSHEELLSSCGIYREIYEAQVNAR